MPWARIEDDYLENPKLVGLSTAAICLDLCAIVFCSRSLRDGYLSVRDVEVVAKLIHLRRWKAVASELVGARRWVELDGGGWVIHDYLKYQPSREHVLSERAAAAERMRRAREKFDGSSPERSPEVRKKFALPVPGPERPTDVLGTVGPPYPLPTTLAGDETANGADGAPPRALASSLETPEDRRTPRQDGTNPRSLGTNPRALGTNPRNEHARCSVDDAIASLYGPRQQIERLPNGAQQCPLCPDIFTGSYSDHLDSPRHKIRPEPDDLSGFHA